MLAGTLACGGTEAELPSEPTGCVADADCGEGQLCQAGSCAHPIPIPVTTRSAGVEACAVVSCPDSDPGCCSGAVASATGNRVQAYSTQLHMLQWVAAEGGEVRAAYRFDAPNQQGWLIFELGSELALDSLEVTGRTEGVTDRYLSVNTNQVDDGGCAFAFKLEPRASTGGAESPPEFGAEVDLDRDQFCYGGGRPGIANELAFAIFSVEPGPASFVISSIALTAR